MHKNCSFVRKDLLGLVAFSIAIVSASVVTASAETSDDIKMKRFAIIGSDECADCGFHGRDYQWCRLGPGPDDWVHCSMTVGVTSRAKLCRSDKWCKHHGKDYLWCGTEDGDWDYCSWVTELSTIPYTIDGRECFSFCKTRDGEDTPTCRTKSGTLAACKLSKYTRNPSDVMEYTLHSEKCENACKKRDGIRRCQTQNQTYVECRPSQERLEQERADSQPEIFNAFRESLSPEDAASMALERDYHLKKFFKEEL